jgi:hypothetical protein
VVAHALLLGPWRLWLRGDCRAFWRRALRRRRGLRAMGWLALAVVLVGFVLVAPWIALFLLPRS